MNSIKKTQIRRLLQIIGHKKGAFWLTNLVLINLILGSIIMNFHVQLYPPFFPFDLKFFFDPFRLEHIWLYTLMLLFFLLGGNMLACILQIFDGIIIYRLKGSLLKKSVTNVLLHTAIILALLAHLIDGFYGDRQSLLIGLRPQQVSVIGAVSLLHSQYIEHPDGSLRDARIELLITDGHIITKKTIAYNEPAFFDQGRHHLIIQSARQQPVGCRLMIEQSTEYLDFYPGISHKLGKETLTMTGIREINRVPIAMFDYQDGLLNSKQENLFIALHSQLDRHHSLSLREGQLTLHEILSEPVLSALFISSPGILFLYSAMFLFAVSLLMYVIRNK